MSLQGTNSVYFVGPHPKKYIIIYLFYGLSSVEHVITHSALEDVAAILKT